MHKKGLEIACLRVYNGGGDRIMILTIEIEKKYISKKEIRVKKLDKKNVNEMVTYITSIR